MDPHTAAFKQIPKKNHVLSNLLIPLLRKIIITFLNI